MLKRTTWKKVPNKLKPSTGLKKSGSIKRKPKSQEQMAEEKEARDKMWEMFERIWQERGPYSEVSGERIPGECRSIYMHHIIPKSSVPALKYIEENIIIMTFSEHSMVENDMHKYPEVNKRREQLKEKYQL